MLRLGKDRDQLSIVSDQIGTPAYARDIAKAILTIITLNIKDKSAFGIYNFSNDEHTNWAEFAKAIFEMKKIDCVVNNITTAEYGAAAHRPLWSVLSKEKINSVFGIKPRPWKESLNECLSLL